MSTLHVFRLNNDTTIPVLGLGVYQMPDNENSRKAIEYALSIGYRHIDTAMIYGNERIVGAAVNSGIVPREQIFITSKVWNSDHGYESTIKAFNTTLKRLNLNYLDLYLIHWPVHGRRKETWKALETLYAEGKCKSIGVSNYMTRHLEELFSYCNIMPAVNQIELHPFIYGSRIDVINLCRKNNILPVAYSPLTKGRRLKDSVLQKIANKYERTAAQILIRWSIQHSFATIPKSSVTSRIHENHQVFDFSISKEDMEILDSLDQGLATGWDPTDTI